MFWQNDLAGVIDTQGQGTLKKILKKHSQWLACDGKGQRALLFNCTLIDVNLPGVDLRKARCSFADMTMTNLAGANLSYADFSFAILMFVNLVGANLTGANFTGVNFTNVNMAGAIIDGADFTGAINLPEDIKEKLKQDEIRKKRNKK